MRLHTSRWNVSHVYEAVVNFNVSFFFFTAVTHGYIWINSQGNLQLLRFHSCYCGNDRRQSWQYFMLAELRRAMRASGAPWVRKFGYDVAYARTLFAGEEYVINRAMSLCNSPFSWREIAQEMAWLLSRSKICLLQLLHCIRILWP